MVKKLVILFSIFILSFEQSAHAEMNPRVKALATMAVYGTVGGTLLGTASLAFDADGRAVAVGASLGLYAGLLFGGYIVGMHAAKKRNMLNRRDDENYYPDTEQSPYEEPAYGDDQVYNFQGPKLLDRSYESPASHAKKPGSKPGQTYFVQLLNYRF